MDQFLNYLRTFLIAGSSVTLISYLANNKNPVLAGIVSGISISIPSLLLINNKSDQHTYTNIMVFMSLLLCLVTIICWFLFIKKGWSSLASVLVSMVIWVLVSSIYYFCKKN